MYIHGTQFNCEVSEVLNELKMQLSANGVHRFAKMFDSGDDLMVCCPYHKDGQERRPSAGIRKIDGKFHCMACGKTVDIDEMIANCFGYTDPVWGYRWLIQNFATVQVEERKEIVLNLSRTSQNAQNSLHFVSEEELDSYRYFHPYMRQRGLTERIIEVFDIGYDQKSDSITFPVRDFETAKCLFVARRSVKYKRFDIPKGIEKPLYGLYELLKLVQSGIKVTEVYVCEGLFDCLRLWCRGKIALAGFGCLFSEYQIKQLENLPVRKLILALDSDKAGRDATAKLRKRIKNKLITEVVLPEGRKDIGECTDEEIDNLQEVW